MTMHDDMNPGAMADRHEQREMRYDEREDQRDAERRISESSFKIKVSTVLTVFVGVLAIIAAASNMWVYSIVQTIDKNSNRISVLETSQASQDRLMEKYFEESSRDRKEIKQRLEIYGENQAVFMAHGGLKAKRFNSLVDLP
jgi:hypothetical protein